MPLRCLDEYGASLHSFALDGAAWDALAATNRRSRSLVMPCCEARVSLKRSALGLQFFAHLGRGGCTTGDESPEHLALKQLAVDAARARDWHAETEVAAIDGNWRADVLATRGRHRVAIEVQWSPQADEETLRRQAQYAAAGVRALWLFRQRSFPASADVPALRVAGSPGRGFTIDGHEAAGVLEGVFDRRLSFGFPAGADVEVRIIGGVSQCWGRECGALSRVVAAIELNHAASRCTLAVEDMPPNSKTTGAVVAALPRGDMIGRVRSRRTTDALSQPLTNACFGCDRVLDTRRIPATSLALLTTARVRIDDEFAQAVMAHPDARLAWGVGATRVARRAASG